MHAYRFSSFHSLTAGIASSCNNWLGMDLLDIEEKRRNQNRLSTSQVRTQTTQISNLPSEVAIEFI